MPTEFLLLGIFFTAMEFHGRRDDFLHRDATWKDGIGVEKCAVTNFGLEDATETGMVTDFLFPGNVFTATEFYGRLNSFIHRIAT